VQGELCVEVPDKINGQENTCNVPKASCAKMLGRTAMSGENYMTPFMRCDPEEMKCVKK
jgi:hypothetical protein